MAVKSSPSIAADLCARMVEAASGGCRPPPATPSPVLPSAPVAAAASPEWDALANSFASLSVAFTWGSILLGLFALVAGLAWGKFVLHAAEKEAREEAKRYADSYIKSWLANEAPTIVQTHVNLLIGTTTGPGDDARAADEMGEST